MYCVLPEYLMKVIIKKINLSIIKILLKQKNAVIKCYLEYRDLNFESTITSYMIGSTSDNKLSS